MTRKLALVGLSVLAMMLSGMSVRDPRGASWWSDDRMDRLRRVVDYRLHSILERVARLEERR